MRELCGWKLISLRVKLGENTGFNVVRSDIHIYIYYVDEMMKSSCFI